MTTPDEEMTEVVMIDGRRIADAVVKGVVANAAAVHELASPGIAEPFDLGDTVAALRANIEAIRHGDLSGIEATLTSQATTLSVIFNELARRTAGSLHDGRHLQETETYLRMTLRAQAAFVRTCEVLATTKNPRPVAVMQTQVNIGVARPQNSAQTELLESSDEQRLDTRATGKAGGADPQLVPVGEVNGATQR